MNHRLASLWIALFTTFTLAAQVSQARQINHSKTPHSVNDGENFFSNPDHSDDKLPRYRSEVKLADKVRIFIQAGTPELDQVRMIGSLKGKQREDVVKIFEKGRAELQPMMTEFNDLRKKMSPALTEKMLSKDEPQVDMMTKPEDYNVLVKARELLQKLRSKRLANWQEIQIKLSPTQLDELDKLKSGEVPTEYLNDAAADNTSDMK